MKLFRFRPPGLESVEVAEQAVGLEQRPTRNDSRIGAIKDPQYRPPKPEKPETSWRMKDQSLDYALGQSLLAGPRWRACVVPGFL